MQNKISLYYNGISNNIYWNQNDIINHINWDTLKIRSRVIKRELYGINLDKHNNNQLK
jgi:hypothetical protein